MVYVEVSGGIGPQSLGTKIEHFTELLEKCFVYNYFTKWLLFITALVASAKLLYVKMGNCSRCAVLLCNQPLMPTQPPTLSGLGN